MFWKAFATNLRFGCSFLLQLRLGDFPLTLPYTELPNKRIWSLQLAAVKGLKCPISTREPDSLQTSELAPQTVVLQNVCLLNSHQWLLHSTNRKWPRTRECLGQDAEKEIWKRFMSHDHRGQLNWSISTYFGNWHRLQATTIWWRDNSFCWQNPQKPTILKRSPLRTDLWWSGRGLLYSWHSQSSQKDVKYFFVFEQKKKNKKVTLTWIRL